MRQSNYGCVGIKKRREKPRRSDFVFAEVLAVQGLVDVADHTFVGG